ncbi:hypothetical protein CES85_3746 (plasmid) [Ochrobactrum quorumnocens]|uniref:Uncharacterized protein n=1 Tax=Ochrobactrum quorumnocens TaxID=271865 RepID=A0A248UMG1_9HYPH|nr:hypothetical protein CES85_3746 [[Ochrobactrum] quorumnocens]
MCSSFSDNAMQQIQAQASDTTRCNRFVWKLIIILERR